MNREQYERVSAVRGQRKSLEKTAETVAGHWKRMLRQQVSWTRCGPMDGDSVELFERNGARKTSVVFLEGPVRPFTREIGADTGMTCIGREFEIKEGIYSSS